ncbi:TonB family C-terminal domain-containing protein [Hymenobacter gelipurpurascens]|uniref:TonB family C-terminal domain-containing protein n=1 Tax=Hymenobacter gelipurpurascens TaxID=89968 RepID=A0A212UCK1_9BACT|nr:TonB family protein [Hymenobacter gelipurpurascens]SNC75811.1 TonB family C-terminal domain-containing protein [Hymenobacter gelipurpurascens]
MKHTLLLSLALVSLLGHSGRAQTVATPKAPANAAVYTYVEQMPVFPGGQQALLQTIGETVNYPTEALEQRLEGRVFVQFVVGTSGQAQDARVTQSLHPLLDAEAVRAVSALPAFSPGRQNGRAVPVAFTLPIIFKIPQNVEEILAARAGKPATASAASVTSDYARFPGGPEALAAYLSAVPYPEGARATQAEGRVYVRFQVSASGKVEQVAAITPKTILPTKALQRRKAAETTSTLSKQTADMQLLLAATQLVTDMPSWKPAFQNGKAIASSMTVPVDFYATAPATAPAPVYAYADQMPGSIGNQGKLAGSMYQGIRYPAEALRRQVQGEVLIYFVVNEQGRVEQAEVIRSVDPLLDAEALRVIQALPASTPPMHQGKPVKVFFTAPVNFAIR